MGYNSLWVRSENNKELNKFIEIFFPTSIYKKQIYQKVFALVTFMSFVGDSLGFGHLEQLELGSEENMREMNHPIEVKSRN